MNLNMTVLRAEWNDHPLANDPNGTSLLRHFLYFTLKFPLDLLVFIDKTRQIDRFYDPEQAHE